MTADCLGNPALSFNVGCLFGDNMAVEKHPSGRLKVLLITALYPSQQNTMCGVFVRNQATLLERAGASVGVLIARSYVPLLNRVSRRWSAVSASDELDDGFVFGKRTVRRPHLPSRVLLAASGPLMARAIRPAAGNLHRDVGFNVVLANQVVPAGYAAVKTAQILDLPAAVYAIGSDLNSYPAFSRLAYRQTCWTLANADMVLTVSRKLAETALQLQRPRRLEPLYYGCNLKTFPTVHEDSSVLRTELGLPPQATILCFCGGISASKGMNELWQSFGRLKKTYHQLHLLLVGDGPLLAQMRRRARREGFATDVTITGFVPETQVARWLNASDIFVLPSHDEGMPMAMIEAMAMRRCVVVSSVGGIPEIVTNGVNGRLVQPGDVDGLCAALSEVIADSVARLQMARLGQQTVRRQLNAVASAHQLVRLLSEVANRHA